MVPSSGGPNWTWHFPRLVSIVDTTFLCRSLLWMIPSYAALLRWHLPMNQEKKAGIFLFKPHISPRQNLFILPVQPRGFHSFFVFFYIVITVFELLPNTRLSLYQSFHYPVTTMSPISDHPMPYHRPLQPDSPISGFENITYYPNWQVYNKLPPSSLSVGSISQIIYAFAG